MQCGRDARARLSAAATWAAWRRAVGAVVIVAGLCAPAAQADSGWQRRSASPIARQEVAAASVGRFIYVVGGFASGAALTTQVERYDAAQDRWELVRPMPMAVNHAVAVAHGGKLYVLGGYTAFPYTFGVPTAGAADATAAFFEYDPASDRWTAMPSAPRPRAAFAAAVIGDRLYAAGGVTTGGPADSMDVFDFGRAQWTPGAPMPLPAEHVAGVALDGAFFVLGGRPFYGAQNFAAVRRYDPATGAWRLRADMARGHAGFGAVSVCDSIVAFGGEQPGEGAAGTIPRTERYDPSADRWTQLPDLGVPRHGLGAAAVDGRVYAIEGGDITFASVTNEVEALGVPCRAISPPRPIVRRARISVSVWPRRVRVRRATRFTVRARAGGLPVVGARVRLQNATARTNRRGLATLVTRFARTGRYVVGVSRSGLLPGSAIVRAFCPPPRR